MTIDAPTIAATAPDTIRIDFSIFDFFMMLTFFYS